MKLKLKFKTINDYYKFRPFLKALAPQLSEQDRRVVDSIVKLVSFLVEGTNSGTGITGTFI